MLVSLVTLFGLGVPGWASAQVSARVYVANRQAATVSVIDGATLAVITTLALPAGSGLQTAAFSADESELLVAGESAGKNLQNRRRDEHAEAGGEPVVKQFAMPFQSRVTIDVSAIPSWRTRASARASTAFRRAWPNG